MEGVAKTVVLDDVWELLLFLEVTAPFAPAPTSSLVATNTPSKVVVVVYGGGGGGCRGGNTVVVVVAAADEDGSVDDDNDDDDGWMIASLDGRRRSLKKAAS